MNASAKTVKTQSVTVREVRSVKDIEDVIVLAYKMHEENASHLDFDPSCIRRYYEAIRYDTTRDTYNCFIAIVENKVVGFLVCVATEYFFSRQICARQELWYVDPSYRSARVALALMKEFEEWARLRGAVEIITGVMIVDDLQRAERIGKLLEKIGYPTVGTYHTKSLTLVRKDNAV